MACSATAHVGSCSAGSPLSSSSSSARARRPERSSSARSSDPDRPCLITDGMSTLAAVARIGSAGDRWRSRPDREVAVHRFRDGERALLIDSKDRRYLITLEAGGAFHTHHGVLDLDQIIGAPEGTTVKATDGARYLAVRPTLADVVLKMPRGAQVIYPKDLGPDPDARRHLPRRPDPRVRGRIRRAEHGAPQGRRRRRRLRGSQRLRRASARERRRVRRRGDRRRRATGSRSGTRTKASTSGTSTAWCSTFLSRGVWCHSPRWR